MIRHLFDVPGTGRFDDDIPGERLAPVRVAFVFAWYDMWVGAYIKTAKDVETGRSDWSDWEVYIMFFMVGFVISSPEPWERGL
jgi:hypothetical protein